MSWSAAGQQDGPGETSRALPPGMHRAAGPDNDPGGRVTVIIFTHTYKIQCCQSVDDLVHRLHLLVVLVEPNGPVGQHDSRQGHLVTVLRYRARRVGDGDAHAAAGVARHLRRSVCGCVCVCSVWGGGGVRREAKWAVKGCQDPESQRQKGDLQPEACCAGSNQRGRRYDPVFLTVAPTSGAGLTQNCRMLCSDARFSQVPSSLTALHWQPETQATLAVPMRS